MSDFNVVDLPRYTSALKGGSGKVKLIGVLIGEVIPPEPFITMGVASKNDVFAVIDLVGMDAISGLHYVKGRALTVVGRSVIDDAKSKPSGRMAIVLSGASVRLSNVSGGVQNFITMMKWVRGRTSNWQFRSATVEPLIRKKYPDFYDVIVSGYQNGWNFKFPSKVPDDYIDACQGHEFELKDKSSGTQKQGYVAPKPEYSGTNTSESESTHGNDQEESTKSNFLGKIPSGSLGVGQSSSDAEEMETLLKNRANTHLDKKLGKKNKVENRNKLAPVSENIKVIEKEILSANNRVLDILDSFGEFPITSQVFESELKYFVDALKGNWSSRAGGYTGRALFKESLERVLSDYDVRTASGDTIINEQLSLRGVQILDSLLDISNVPDELQDDFLKSLFGNRISIYLTAIEVLLGIRGKLVPCWVECEEREVDMMQVLYNNPYNLCYIDPRFTIEDLDKLAMLYDIDMSDLDVSRVRNIAYMHNYMLDSNNRVVGDNTIVRHTDLLRQVKSGYVFSKRNVDALRDEGYLISRDKLLSLKTFIFDDLKEGRFSLPTRGWQKIGHREVLETGGSSGNVIRDYIDSGLGIKATINGVTWVADFVYAKKEMYIYNRLRELCEYRPVEVDKDKIAKTVESFEKMKHKELMMRPDQEYKLEARQAEAMYLISNRAACLTGPAGSGKTTTAEGMVYAIETHLGIPSEAIMFCGPTGKAANRLKEVVKRETRTINSLFGIGGEGIMIKDDSEVRKKDEILALIVDESSMPNINLMYELVLRLANGTYVFFLGDKEQLPPIGAGKPFVSMLSFLPTVVLNVTKRASDKSGITKNANRLIYESDGIIEDLVSYDDFRILNTKDQNKAVEAVKRVVSHHLGRGTLGGFTPVTVKDKDGFELVGDNLHPDDIQVITPVNGNVWGTIALNNMLQDIFNPKQFYMPSVFYKRGSDDNIEFRLGDRVMHVRANQSERTRLVKHGKSSFTRLKNAHGVPMQGISNGEVGKVVGFYNAKDIDFDLEESENVIQELKQEFRGTENVMFMAVEFKSIDVDTLENIDFIILYRMEILQKQENNFVVLSSDLKYVDLCYASTVHKLQGSQAKLCIVVMLPVGNGSFASKFISRNMLYTACTRGQVADYLIGDVYGKESCVNKGRKYEQSEERNALLDLI